MTTRITPGVGANLLGQHAAERNQDATVYVGNLDSQVSSQICIFFCFRTPLQYDKLLLSKGKRRDIVGVVYARRSCWYE